MVRLNFLIAFFTTLSALCFHSAQCFGQDNSSADQVLLKTDKGEIPALYRDETSGTAHGGVLVIPDNGRHPGTHGNINTLRITLADNHWHTLAINITERDADDIQKLIAAGILFLNEKGVFNIAVLGEGQGAAHALHYVANLPPVKEDEIRQIRALLMLNANNSVAGLKGHAMASLAELEVPILDAYFGNNYREQQQALARKRLSKRQYVQYQQARLPYASNQNPSQENRVTKRIRGWLDKNVAGFMVDTH